MGAWILRTVGFVVAAAVTACTGDQPAPPAEVPPEAPASPTGSPPESPPPPPAAPPAETGGGWSQEPVDGGGLSSGVATLTAVRTAAHDGHDRIVFEFAGALPGFRIAYADAPVVQCGSGEPVAVAGSATLEISFEPAAAHDDAGHATIQERARTLELDRLIALLLICDFEAHVDWLAGLAGRADFRVTTLESPARLVVDLRHPTGGS